ncbi:hypothetical protein [Candidatus Burkholderia verschuerenii]|nr:hypothetical protein [Candidatus Burkholderia verschuerenii]
MTRLAPVTKPVSSLDTRSLYDMLQHSPTLDDNFNAGVSGNEARHASAK